MPKFCNHCQIKLKNEKRNECDKCRMAKYRSKKDFEKKMRKMSDEEDITLNECYSRFYNNFVEWKKESTIDMKRMHEEIGELIKENEELRRMIEELRNIPKGLIGGVSKDMSKEIIKEEDLKCIESEFEDDIERGEVIEIRRPVFRRKIKSPKKTVEQTVEQEIVKQPKSPKKVVIVKQEVTKQPKSPKKDTIIKQETVKRPVKSPKKVIVEKQEVVKQPKSPKKQFIDDFAFLDGDTFVGMKKRK